VAQIPALLISVAAAMVVSRVGKDEDIGSRSAARSSIRRVAGPDRRHRRAPGLVPGMPHLVFC
jgi:flagellar biosynthesis protein FlhA